MNTSPPSFFFHQPSFVFRNPKDSIVPFEESNLKIYFSRIGNSLISLDRSPFGGFVMDESTTKQHLLLMLAKIDQWSKIHDVTNLVIRSFPEIYSPDQSALMTEVLIEAGFIIQYQDITQVIAVSDTDSMDLNTHKKRRLRKAQASGFTFRELPVEYLAESYRLIVESRESKGYPVTMALNQLEEMFRLFPERYLLFGLSDKNKLIASSVSIKVNDDVLYCFYLGDDLLYRAYSPVTVLVNGIYHFCSKNKYKMLDLGISTDKGVLNKGLYAFKKTFGCIDSYKLTFLKQL